MEDFYREIYAVNGITDIKFPEHYPVSRLLGLEYLPHLPSFHAIGFNFLSLGNKLLVSVSNKV